MSLLNANQIQEIGVLTKLIESLVKVRQEVGCIESLEPTLEMVFQQLSQIFPKSVEE
jgi:hypothetical protein